VVTIESAKKKPGWLARFFVASVEMRLHHSAARAVTESAPDLFVTG
jgi:hypothetical protein